MGCAGRAGGWQGAGRGLAHVAQVAKAAWHGGGTHTYTACEDGRAWGCVAGEAAALAGK